MNPSPILWILAVFSGISAEKFQVVQKHLTILAEEGQSVLIPCEWTGKVTQTIGSFKWLKNGMEVSNLTAKYTGRVHRSQENFIHSRNASLLLKELRVTDSGMYTCSVKFMQLGEQYGNGTQLTVRGISAEKFQVVQKHLTILAEEGQSVLIPCEWTGKVTQTIGSFKWLKNGMEVSNLTAKYTGRVHRSQENFIHSRNASLLLKELRVTDSGMYTCSVKFMQLGEQYGNGTQLTVRGISAEKFQVVQKLPTILAEEGQSVLIPCEWTGNVSQTIGSFKWLKKGMEVSNQTAKYTGRVYRSQGNFIHSRDASLLLKELRVTDSGMYTCSVKFMQLGEQYGNGTQLTVRGISAEKFQVVQKLPTILAEEGQSVLIPCEWTGNVSQTIGSFKWLKKGMEVSNQTAKYTGRVYRSQGNFIHSRDASLLLKELRVTDSGMYTCSVKFMQLGEQYGNGTQLTVRGISAEKFQVVQKHLTILAEEGQSVLIPCEWTGKVTQTIGSFKWLKNSTEVSNLTAKYTGRVHRSQENFIHSRNASLLLKELRVTDSGMYRCSVKFMQLGEQYGNGTQLTVREKPKGSMTLWLFLLISALVQLVLLLIAVPYYVKLHRMKGAQRAQRQVQFISEVICIDDILTLPVLDEVQNLDQDKSVLESDAPCMVENNEDTSIYTPMESLKPFSKSTATEMDCQIPSPKPWTTSSSDVQYAKLVLNKTYGSSSLNAIVEDDDLEHDYGYDELNVTAKRYPKPESIPRDEENGENPQECTEVVNE